MNQEYKLWGSHDTHTVYLLCSEWDFGTSLELEKLYIFCLPVYGYLYSQDMLWKLGQNLSTEEAQGNIVLISTLSQN